MTTSRYALGELRRRHDAADTADVMIALEGALELLEEENRRETVLGFENHATAMVLLWIENEEHMLRACTTLTNDARANAEADEGRPDEHPSAVVILADTLRALIEGRPAVRLVCGGPNPTDMEHVGDLVTAALDSVAWLELAAHFLATIDAPAEEVTP